jgi:hypothetical protein
LKLAFGNLNHRLAIHANKTVPKINKNSETATSVNTSAANSITSPPNSLAYISTMARERTQSIVSALISLLL